MRSQQQQKNNDSGLFSSLKSMANDLIGNSPQSSQHPQQQQPKRSAPTSTTSSPQINTNSSNNSSLKTQTLFPSYQTLQTALPQEIERVRSVLQNPNATLSQLEQGDRALDDLVVLLTSNLAHLAEMKRENSKRLINKLKSTSTTTPSNATVSPVSTKSPSSTTSTHNNTTNVKTQQTTTEKKGFGAIANRSSTKPTTPSSGSAGNLLATSSTNNKSVPIGNASPLESMLEWQENETIDEPPKPQEKEQELFSMDSFDHPFTQNTTPTTDQIQVPQTDMLDITTTESADDILGFDNGSSNKPKEGAFLDELLGTEKSGNQGVMIDFSDEGQKIYQSNQILSMFDKPAETTASILDADDIPVATTSTVSSMDEFDF